MFCVRKHWSLSKYFFPVREKAGEPQQNQNFRSRAGFSKKLYLNINWIITTLFYSFDRQDRSVYNLVRRCVDEGNWAVIQNIHLYPELVDQILDQLQQDQKDFGNEFRLWMIGFASS